ncbi:OLC1v1024158C1 [Oldenlandia corymbosa var. corymbosa]|uniref:OLC1v1024158C1 n=1 Tax=Oldenlandia corymbosa var. corymbosa TaxID=529605 RepID=A0AAV1C562_OLDCO|nr:OLC1v1024158C1 [Oldenlandia corymbosa var. corymbosa]
MAEGQGEGADAEVTRFKEALSPLGEEDGPFVPDVVLVDPPVLVGGVGVVGALPLVGGTAIGERSGTASAVGDGMVTVKIITKLSPVS